MNDYSYTLLLAGALVLGMWVCERRASDPALARRTCLLAIAAGLVGARFWYALQYGTFGWRGGLSIWGFLIFSTLAATVYLKRKTGDWDLAGFPDSAAPALALGIAVQRLGCYSAGCCYGKLTDLPWAVSFGPDTPAFEKHVSMGLVSPDSLFSRPVHPTQLYEAGFMLLVFGVMWFFHRPLRRRLLNHELLLGFVWSVAVWRFLLEYLRDDAGGFSVSPFTFAQGTTLGVVLFLGWLIGLRRIRRYRRSWGGGGSS